jgi:hypothetical protein
MQIFVRTAGGRCLCLAAYKGDSVDSFRQRIPAAAGGEDSSRLVFAGKQLASGFTLQDYNLQDGSTVTELLRLRGGGVSRVGHVGPVAVGKSTFRAPLLRHLLRHWAPAAADIPHVLQNDAGQNNCCGAEERCQDSGWEECSCLFLRTWLLMR